MKPETASVSPREALDALEAVREVERRTRGAIAAAGGGRVVTAWGLAWGIGFLATHFLDGREILWVWLALNLAGFAATAWIVAGTTQRVRDPVGPRIGGLWLALFAYTALWIFVAAPLDGNEIGLLISSAAMFGYVVMGLWLDRTFLWIGLSVTAASIAGFLLLPALFNLWMAFLGGGALIAAGLRIQRRWVG